MSQRVDRQKTILDILARDRRAGVDELASLLGVTGMTVRRDLSAMEAAGQVTRTHGGCVLRSPFVEEVPFTEKEKQQRAQKLGIAREAVRLFGSCETLYLDTGTTAVHVAERLPAGRKLHVFTSNLRAAMSLFSHNQSEVVVFGGTLGGKSPDLTGEMTVAQIRQFRFDAALVGADALDAEAGVFFSADLPTAMVSRAAQEQARRTVLAVDASKFGKQSLAKAGELGHGITLVTDASAPEAMVAAVRRTGAQIVLAPREGER